MQLNPARSCFDGKPLTERESQSNGLQQQRNDPFREKKMKFAQNDSIGRIFAKSDGPVLELKMSPNFRLHFFFSRNLCLLRILIVCIRTMIRNVHSRFKLWRHVIVFV
jgi:hypothetical protein